MLKEILRSYKNSLTKHLRNLYANTDTDSHKHTLNLNFGLNLAET